MDTTSSNRLLRLPEVARLTSLGRSTVNLWVSQGKFPAPTALSSTIKVWRHADIERWIDEVCSPEHGNSGADSNQPSNVRPLRTRQKDSRQEDYAGLPERSRTTLQRQAESL